MSPRPYRELALVSRVDEPAALWPWHPVETRSCPKGCSTAYSVQVVGGFCTGYAGHTRFWPFRKVLAACTETRGHFHVQCPICGWMTLMATADAT